VDWHATGDWGDRMTVRLSDRSDTLLRHANRLRHASDP